MGKSLFPGCVINHSKIELLVLETDSGSAIVHYLRGKSKSPSAVDADAFRRADGKPILGHAGWWKIPDWFTADIYQISTDVIIPFSVMFPVGDNQFGEYVLDKSINWGTNLTYVESIKYDDKGKVESYFITNVGEITLDVALNMAKSGHLDNVVVVTNRKGKTYLRTKRNVTTLRNLT